MVLILIFFSFAILFTFLAYSNMKIKSERSFQRAGRRIATADQRAETVDKQQRLTKARCRPVRCKKLLSSIISYTYKLHALPKGCAHPNENRRMIAIQTQPNW